MWYAIKLPGFSYEFETDRYRSEMEARAHIRETLTSGRWHPAIRAQYMADLKIRPLYNRVDSNTTPE